MRKDSSSKGEQRPHSTGGNAPEINPSLEKTILGADHFKKHFAEIKSSMKRKSSQKVSAFPLEIFPLQLQVIIKATHQYLKFPIDFTAASLLYAISVAIGNTHWLYVKNEWYERAIFYMVIIGRPGINKSHPLSWALKPLFDYDSESFSRFEKENQLYEAFLGMSKQEKEDNDMEYMDKPIYKKFMLSDTTPESIISVHKHNKRGVGVFVDELAGWFKNFNRYNKGAEQESWLSNWSAKPIIIDRKTEGPTNIKNPCISVMGTIQEAILPEIGGNNRSLNGFIDRILYVFPDGLKKERWTPTDLPGEVSTSWQFILNKLIDHEQELDESGNVKPTIIHLGEESSAIFQQWQSQHTDMCNELGNDILVGFYTKLEQYCLRFALLLQLISNTCNEQSQSIVTADNLHGAIKLTEYFRSTVNKMYEVVFESTAVDALPANIRAFYDSLPVSIKTADAIAMGEKNGIRERTVKRLLDPKCKLFIRVSHGYYEKVL